jgi:hypothetical protein
LPITRFQGNRVEVGYLESTSVIVFAMLLPILALAMMQSPCSLYVGVSNDGNIFFDRFQGWVRIEATVLGGVLQQGCRTYVTSESKPVTSVRFVVAPKAPQEKVDVVFPILEKYGWTREQVIVEPWNSQIRKVSGRFYIDKLTFSIGEPVVLHFEVINSGSEPYWFDTTGLPGMPSCSGYLVKVSHHDMTPVTNTRRVRGNTCIMNGQFKHVVIDPGAKYTKDIDLSLYLDLSVRGKYVVQVEHRSFRRNGDPDDPLDSKATFKLQLK